MTLTSCGRKQTVEKPKETESITTDKGKKDKRVSFYNSNYIYVNGKQDKLEQRTRKGKLIGKLGSGKVCSVNEKWLYYVVQKNGMITMWRVPIPESKNELVQMKKKEKIFSVTGKLVGRICVEEPYIIFAIDRVKDELYQYNMEKGSRIPCNFEIPYVEMGDSLDILDIELERGISYVSVEDHGIFKQDLNKGETQAKCIYDGMYSCQTLHAWKENLFFDHGNYTEPPLDAFCVKSYSEKNNILWEVSAGNIEKVIRKYFTEAGKDNVTDIEYNSVFGDFWLDDGKLYILADDITYNETGKKKSFSPVLSYDPLTGEKSLVYEKELTNFLRGKENLNIVDVIQGKVLVQGKQQAYEFDLQTKKYRKLQQSDTNYWYIHCYFSWHTKIQ